MSTELVHIGFKNFVPINRVVAVLSRGTSPSGPLKRLIEKSKAEGKLLNLTRGRKAKTVLVMDSDHIILSAIAPETIVERLNEKRSQKIEGAIFSGSAT